MVDALLSDAEVLAFDDIVSEILASVCSPGKLHERVWDVPVACDESREVWTAGEAPSRTPEPVGGPPGIAAQQDVAGRAAVKIARTNHFLVRRKFRTQY